MAVTKKTSVEIDVVEMKQGELTLCLIGVTPFLFNAVTGKAHRELLMPRGPMSAADKLHNLKHDPISEFRGSVYQRASYEPGPTRLLFKASAFKGSMASAAVDMPASVRKAQVGRLAWVKGEAGHANFVSFYGVPRVHMDIVRSADMGKTPDVRTRACCPEWAVRAVVRYTMPVVTPRIIATLASAGGMINGVGDGRPEKGKLDFGQYRLVDEDDADFQRIISTCGRAAQDEALANPVAYDSLAEELLTWFGQEIEKRRTSKDAGDAVPAIAARKKRGNGAAALTA